MLKVKSMLVLTAVCVGSLAVVLPARAATHRVKVSGGTRLHGTSTTGALLSNASTSQAFGCAQSGLHATASGHVTSTTRPVGIAQNVALSASSCTLPGGFPFIVTCSPSRLGVTGATTGAGVTPGKLEGIDCDIRLGTVTSTCRVRMSGGTGVSYANATHQLVLDGNHAELAFTGSPSGCFWKNGTSVRMMATGGVNDLVYGIAPAVSITATVS